MDKNAIKKFAVWARRELISRVAQKALQYGISDKEIVSADAGSIDGTVLSDSEKKQRKALVEQINKKGYEQVMEEVAYTWFNRFMALRYMEVNSYLPSKVRVFTDESNAFKPQIIDEAIHMDLAGLDLEKVYALKEANKIDELYKYLLITQCNALNEVLPGMFQKIEDYTELLFPDNLLREGSVIEQMIALIPEEDWMDAVQIIGWLYQYYNTEKKDEVFAALKKNVKITKDNIPAATQLFTPDWIVRYMVENSLGRLWVEGHPDTKSQVIPTEEEQKTYAETKQNDGKWHYYLEEAEQEPEVQTKLAEIRKEYANLNPEDIKCIDPCMGSGHILAYMFDVLVQIYEAYGYTTRDAVASIVENNLYGLDIDDRAAQLAYFAVMMKACQYDKRFLRRGIQPKVYAIVESNGVDNYALEYFCNGDAKLTEAMNTIVRELHDAKEYGSILTVTNQDWEYIYNRFEVVKEDISMAKDGALALEPMVRVAQLLAQKYDAVVTNPPYMGASGMNAKLSEFIKNNYADYKSDFFSAFVIHSAQMAKKNGYCGFLTPYVWMFIQSYEKMRNFLYHNTTIETLIQFEYSAFEEATVPICTFAFRKGNVNKKGCYLRLTEFKGGMEVQRQKALEAISDHKCGFYYEQSADNFEKIPGSPVAYWARKQIIEAFKMRKLSEECQTRKGLATSDNNRFLRLWFEVSVYNISFNCASNDESEKNGKKWFPHNKGGDFHRWYGNNSYIINWKQNGYEIKNFRDSHGKLLSRPQNLNYNFKQAVTWSKITSGNFSARICKGGFLFDDAAAICYHSDINYLMYILALMNSKCCQHVLRMLNPTMNVQIGDIGNIPVLVKQQSLVIGYVTKTIEITKKDWDSFETSWDFKKHPLI